MDDDKAIDRTINIFSQLMRRSDVVDTGAATTAYRQIVAALLTIAAISYIAGADLESEWSKR